MPSAFYIDLNLEKVLEVAEEPDLARTDRVFDTQHNLTDKTPKFGSKKQKEKKEVLTAVERFF